MFPMFVVDLMHEVELGTWRSLFIHLLRILQAAAPNLTHELDRRWGLEGVIYDLLTKFPTLLRYREVPTFGRDTIRKFSSNTSEMKQLAARDFEDLLQVRSTTISCHDTI